MQQITRGTNSYLLMTLREKQTLTNPTFLFRFINEASKNEKVFIAADSSLYPLRYNKFLITETSSNENLTSGVVTLETGIYYYEAYEQTSTTNLVWQNVDNPKPLEVGLAKVTGSETVTFTHTINTDKFSWTNQ